MGSEELWGTAEQTGYLNVIMSTTAKHYAMAVYNPFEGVEALQACIKI